MNLQGATSSEMKAKMSTITVVISVVSGVFDRAKHEVIQS